jgi:hypothetical protein
VAQLPYCLCEELPPPGLAALAFLKDIVAACRYCDETLTQGDYFIDWKDWHLYIWFRHNEDRVMFLLAQN